MEERARALKLALLSALFAGCASSATGEAQRPPPRVQSPATAEVEPPPSPAALARAALLLDRITHGSRPGERERVARDPQAFLDRQLHPERIDDAAFEAQFAERFADLERPIDEVRRLYPRRDGDAQVEGRHAGELIPLCVGAKLARAIYSERQLEEVLVDFWFNHFNVYAPKGDVRWSVADYERRAIRQFVFGSFRELLGATAHHPAMLYYLDNWQSSVEAEARGKRPARGLNENYGRELLELHTLGVDGGYGQNDVREVALALTGWTITRDRAAFEFDEARHAPGPRHVLGVTIDAGGQADGEAVLDLLAAHPSTARFIARALAEKFVADDPDPALVNRLAVTFAASQGQLRDIYADLFASPEFAVSRNGKTKTPFELVVSSLRAVGARYEASPQLDKWLERMGQSLYRAEPPTGYRETAAYWINSGGLVARLNFGLDLASGNVPGASFDDARLLGDLGELSDGQLIERLAERILDQPLGAATERTIEAVLERQGASQFGEDAMLKQRQVLGLLLGSPEFQTQ